MQLSKSAGVTDNSGIYVAPHLQNLVFRMHIQCTGCFVKYDNLWVAQKATRNPDALLLPAAEAHPTVADWRVQARWKRLH